jgi:CDP-6-deoxy-D-xylo-4-hexulose-3-dehydrase
MMHIPLASSGLREKDIHLAVQTLKSGNLTMGEQVRIFEERMASYLNVSNFVMVNSGSSANLAIIESLLRPAKGKPILNPGDSVLVPAIAWPTTIWPLIQLGLNPLFIDVNPKTLAIDLESAQSFIDSSRIPVRSIFPIHPLGYAIPPSELDAFVRKNDLILINDVCESLGSWSEGAHAGTTGIASSFSFYFSHHITTMEGGGIATNNDTVADDLRSIRSHGWSRDRKDSKTWSSSLSSNDSKFLFVSAGYNIRPMEIQAAIGISQIEDIDIFIDKRRKIARSVINAVKGTNLQVIGAEHVEGTNHSWMLIPLQVQSSQKGKDKKRILEILEQSNIETRPVLTGNFLAQPAIQRITRHNADPLKFVNANHITETSFLIGAHHDLNDEQIEYLVDKLSHAANEI